MYIFDSHSRDGSGMPSANGTAVLMQFDNIQTMVSFICKLADSLAARLFHWTFWHSVPTTSCDCDTYLGKSIPAIDVLSEGGNYENVILNLYHPTVNQITERTSINHIENEFDSQKHLSRQTKEDSLTGITKLQQDKQKHMKKLHVDERITDNGRTHPGHKKHPKKLKNVNRLPK